MKYIFFSILFLLSACSSKPLVAPVNKTTVVIMSHGNSYKERSALEFYKQSAISGTFSVGSEHYFFGKIEGASLYGLQDYEASLMYSSMIAYGEALISKNHFLSLNQFEPTSEEFIYSMTIIEKMIIDLQLFINQNENQKGELFKRAFGDNNPLKKEFAQRDHLQYINENLSSAMFDKIASFYQEIIISFAASLKFNQNELKIIANFLDDPLLSANIKVAKNLMDKKTNEKIAQNIAQIYAKTSSDFFLVPIHQSGIQSLIESLKKQKVKFLIKELVPGN